MGGMADILRESNPKSMVKPTKNKYRIFVILFMESSIYRYCFE